MSYGLYEWRDNKTRAYVPKRPEFQHLKSRMETFTEWKVAFLDSERVARAGFWYLGEADRVRCFYCGGGLRNWEPRDDPLMEHKRIFPTCGFLQQLSENGATSGDETNLEVMHNKSKL